MVYQKRRHFLEPVQCMEPRVLFCSYVIHVIQKPLERKRPSMLEPASNKLKSDRYFSPISNKWIITFYTFTCYEHKNRIHILYMFILVYKHPGCVDIYIGIHVVGICQSKQSCRDNEEYWISQMFKTSKEYRIGRISIPAQYKQCNTRNIMSYK